LGEDDAQNLAFCFRTPQKLLVVHSDLSGDIQIEPYNEFLNKPFVKQVKVRSFINPPPMFVEQATRFVENLRE